MSNFKKGLILINVCHIIDIEDLYPVMELYHIVRVRGPINKDSDFMVVLKDWEVREEK